MFIGMHPLYSQHIIKEQYNIITICYTQPSYSFQKVINRSLTRTNNYKPHYKKEHPEILYTKKQKEVIVDKKAELKKRKPFFISPIAEQSYNK